VEVTSFLLNEKRTEITKIELEQRVTVLLVPNKHLETPNYKLERLRHDDPRLEGLQASYTMIEEPSDEVGITRREKAKPKQEPIIKGVLPDMPAPPAPPPPPPRPVPAPVAAAPVAQPPRPAPAPVVASTEGAGFFGWVKRLFGVEPASPTPASASRSAPPTVTTTPVTPAPPGTSATPDKRDGRRGERGERGNRGGDRGPRSGRDRDGREGREGREPRESRDARNGRRDTPPAESTPPAAERDTRGPRPERVDRPEGGRRGPRPERATTEALAPAALAVLADNPEAVDGIIAPVAAEGDRDGARRRRRRGGRDRSEGRSEVGGEGGEQADTGERADVRAETPAEPGGVQAEADAQPPREGGEREGGRSRGGRGRGRRDGAEGREPAAAEAEPAVETHAAYVEDAADAPAASAGLAIEPAPAAPMAPPPALRAEPAAPAATAPAPPPPSVAAPVRIEPYVLPTESLVSIAQGVGLEWVNSDADKMLAVRTSMAAEPPLAHVPRAPRAALVVDDGPLVLVETRKDLSQLKLPFEQRAV